MRRKIPRDAFVMQLPVAVAGVDRRVAVPEIEPAFPAPFRSHASPIRNRVLPVWIEPERLYISFVLSRFRKAKPASPFAKKHFRESQYFQMSPIGFAVGVGGNGPAWRSAVRAA